ncbi:RNA polymerase-associated protein RapA [Clostridium acetireducens DSM 10703]|uniref:RNA polymerase-associated protein RapA n=1 Tax=Clostridium acetireducens DSM 10703 TaxID=1121290 RepID=A0A1E8F1M3_9CLOT|nr:helicase-related protein [Clostridium acetireducens]OFI07086.1 RNA polymerase-associated protein RapA [Clostridium acetireducens DSM 10703]
MERYIRNSLDFVEIINQILEKNPGSIINIVNDKFTLSVFNALKDNLANIKKVRLIIRDMYSLDNKNEEYIKKEIKDILFGEYDIRRKNKLEHFSTSKNMYEFIENKVEVKIVNPKYKVRGNMFIIGDKFMITGSSSLEFDKGLSNREINFNTVIDYTIDKEQIKVFNEQFNQLWYGDNFLSDYKQDLKESIISIYKEYSPEFLYYYTLNELFGKQLDYGVERFEKDNISFKDTEIWKTLYPFQKDAVLSAIQKINKYNGCIIADSVGLGKTFEALAVIKYFEMRQDNVLVLTPAKLFDNWMSFKGGYKDSVLDERFNYKIMFHTDLSRYKGESRTGIDLKRFDWSNFDLIVIDESHNFRNRIERDNGYTRYQRLLEEAIKEGINTKVLLLSATPVNNSLVDLKNQISIITADKDDALKKQGIPSIDGTLRRTTRQINQWEENPNKRKEELFNGLPSDFYKLLEMLTIARSRNHITNYYGTEGIGSFPEKLKPKTLTPTIDVKEELLKFKNTNDLLEDLNLAVYAPMSYLKREYIEYYTDKYEKRRSDGRVYITMSVQETGMKVLHRFNLFKRLESSVYSFKETLRRLLERINSYVNIIEKSEKNIDLIEEDIEEEILDYKYEVKVDHLRKEEFLEDLYYDKIILEEIYKEAEKILEDNRDKKLKVLNEFIINKIRKEPFNKGNKKVLIFTAFKDTAEYLYKNLQNELLKEGVYTGLVTGSGKPKSNNKNVDLDFNSLLCSFSPKAKLKKSLPRENEIDILIGTDCISEGQNLQDCDTVINFDIQWNPVSLIQRFGRIDRIGSKNKEIKMVNFFPDLELNEYLNLEQRVKNKMTIGNIVGTGDSNPLTPEMNDINFRKKQLERLTEEVIDIDEASDSISLTDLNMNEYLYELSNYIKENPELKKIPKGIFSITDKGKKGVIYCFKHKNNDLKPKNDSSLYPYYLVYIDYKGNVLYEENTDRNILREFRRLSKSKYKILKESYNKLIKETKNFKDMSKYINLLEKSIDSIQGKEEEEAEQTIFDFGGYQNLFKKETIDDFELVSFLIVD